MRAIENENKNHKNKNERDIEQNEKKSYSAAAVMYKTTLNGKKKTKRAVQNIYI